MVKRKVDVSDDIVNIESVNDKQKKKLFLILMSCDPKQLERVRNHFLK